MENSFVLRTEEMLDDEIQRIYVPTSEDVTILEKLKSKTPIILVGSRGMGKSFLFRISQLQVEQDVSVNILPVNVTFRNAPLLQTANRMQFQEWMLNRIVSTLLRTLKSKGYLPRNNWSFTGMENQEFDENSWPKRLEMINQQYENSWKKPGESIDTSELPSVDDLIELVEDICKESDIDRVIIYIDEAAHVFIPEQQIQFFSLFRELRSPYLKCNASVYPGVTYYGNIFDKTHDAEFVTMARDIMSPNYVDNMKDMVLKQINDDGVREVFLQKGEDFTALAFAASGNPRLLLRSISELKTLSTKNVNEVIREFYREEIWREHSDLVDKYPKRTTYIDWGRGFIEDEVLPEIKKKNDKLITEQNESTLFFWIDRNAPQSVKEALRILEYTGLIRLQSTGVKATGSIIGTRYEVNMGCVLAQESSPKNRCMEIIKNLSLRRMNEYGANSKSFDDIKDFAPLDDCKGRSDDLNKLLANSIDILQLTDWQKTKIHSFGINTIKELMATDEKALQQITYIGDFRSRQIKNAALAAVFEYLF